ncbi:MAG TPA: GNAT family N-acetyltransferase [Bryobacteraceae bacterium]|nr:GNAT family N-acetyltransferase [Bryobacteraceae bacterium]
MNLLQRIYTTVYRRVWIVSKEFATHTDATANGDFTMRYLDAKSLDAYEAFRPGQTAKAVERMEGGSRAILVCDGDQIVGCVWASTDRAYIPYIDRDIVLRPGEMYTHDAFTHPDYRRRGVATIRNSMLVREYKRLGYERAAGIVAFENHVGLRSAESAGYARVGVFACVRLGFRQLDLPGRGCEGEQKRFVSPLNRRGG